MVNFLSLLTQIWFLSSSIAIHHVNSQIRPLITAPSDIYQQTDRFACQCFCMIADFEVDPKTRVAHTIGRPSFGYGVDAVPIRSSRDIEFWLSVYRKRQLRRFQLPSGKLGVQSFSTAFIVNSPPKMPEKERNLLLDKLSNGEYMKAKMAFMTTKDKDYERQMRDIERKQGMPPVKPSSRQRKLYLHRDKRHYRNASEKVDAWRRHCHSQCDRAVKQDQRMMHFKNHKEMAFLKHYIEPYDEKTWISAEPIHEGEMGVGVALNSKQKGLVKERGIWAENIKRQFAPLFHAMRTRRHAFPPCPVLERRVSERNREKNLDWNKIGVEFGVVRNPREIDPPGRSRVLLRAPGDPRGPIIGIQRQMFNPEKPILPVIMDVKNWLDMVADDALRRKLVSLKQEAVDWPANLPGMFTRQVTPQYRFKAKLQGADIGFKIISLFYGTPSASRPGLTEFLHVYMNDLESEGLETNLRNILLYHWGKTVLEAYQEKGLKIGGIVKSRRRGRKEAPGEESESEGDEENEGDDEGGEDDLDDDDAEEDGFEGSASGGGEEASMIQQGETYKKESYAHDHGWDKRMSFVQKRAKDEGGKIDYLDIEYAGAMFIGCWHHVTPGNTIDPDNRLAFIIKPLKFTLVRRDGLRIRVPAESDSVVVQLLGSMKQGIRRLDDGFLSTGVKPAFTESMNQYCPKESKVIYRVLTTVFKIHEGLEYLQRNTCPLDNKRMDIEIGEHCKKDTLLLYADKDPKNLNQIPITLTGAPLQKLTGEYMAKCYGVVLPTATVMRLKGNPPIKYRLECERTTLGKYQLVERGPYSVAKAPLNALPKRRVKAKSSDSASTSKDAEASGGGLSHSRSIGNDEDNDGGSSLEKSQ